jgi:hypothetical protein
MTPQDPPQVRNCDDFENDLPNVDAKREEVMLA